jgi:hypothetical protein
VNCNNSKCCLPYLFLFYGVKRCKPCGLFSSQRFFLTQLLYIDTIGIQSRSSKQGSNLRRSDCHQGAGLGVGVLYMRAEEGFCVSLLQALALKYGGQNSECLWCNSIAGISGRNHRQVERLENWREQDFVFPG